MIWQCNKDWILSYSGASIATKSMSADNYKSLPSLEWIWIYVMAMADQRGLASTFASFAIFVRHGCGMTTASRHCDVILSIYSDSRAIVLLVSNPCLSPTLVLCTFSAIQLRNNHFLYEKRIKSEGAQGQSLLTIKQTLHCAYTGRRPKEHRSKLQNLKVRHDSVTIGDPHADMSWKSVCDRIVAIESWMSAATAASIRVASAKPGSVPDNVHDVQSAKHFQSLMSADLERISILFFWAAWAAPCAQMGEVIRELARKYSNILVLQVRFDILVCDRHKVLERSCYPTILAEGQRYYDAIGFFESAFRGAGFMYGIYADFTSSIPLD